MQGTSSLAGVQVFKNGRTQHFFGNQNPRFGNDFGFFASIVIKRDMVLQIKQSVALRDRELIKINIIRIKVVVMRIQ